MGSECTAEAEGAGGRASRAYAIAGGTLDMGSRFGGGTPWSKQFRSLRWRPGPVPDLPQSTREGSASLTAAALSYRHRGDRAHSRALEEPSSGNWPAPRWASSNVARSFSRTVPRLPALLLPDGPVTVFEVDGEYGVLPSDEIDASDDLEVIDEFHPWAAH